MASSSRHIEPLLPSGPTTWNASANLTGTGSLSASASRTTFASAALTGTGSLSASFAALVTASAALTGTGTLAATALLSVTASAALTGSGTLTARPRVTSATTLRALYYAPGQFPTGTFHQVAVSDERGFLADLQGPGQAHLVLQNDSPIQPVSDGVIAFDLFGERAFAALCEKKQRASIRLNKADEKTTWEMPGHLAVTKKGVIGPPGGVGRFPVAETIAYNYTHFDYDPDPAEWDPANVLYSFASLVAAWAFISGGTIVPGAGFNGDTASMIGPTSATTTDAPEGDWYFRGTVTVPAAGPYTIYLTSDDYATLYLDGISILTNGGFTQSTSQVFTLSAGTHVVSGTVHQYGPNPFFPTLNPTYVGVSCFPGGGAFEGTTPTWTSNSSWVVNDYPADIPGMTIGTVLTLALTEHAGKWWADAILAALTFGQVNDSNGDAWGTFHNITATVGEDTVLGLIEKLQESYADLWLDPNGWALHAYPIGTFNPASLVVLDETNIAELTHTTEAPLATKLLIRSDGLGWSVSGSGDVESFLRLGTEVSPTDVASIAATVIAKFGEERKEVEVLYAPDLTASPSQVPWVNANFVPGASATAPDEDGSALNERVQSLGASMSKDAEKLQVKLILMDRIQEINERVIKEITG